MNKEFDTLVFIGRFQPLHNGHIAVINKAKELANKVLILIGSAYQPRDTKNPFTYDERKEMFNKAFPNDMETQISVSPIKDYPYDDSKWISAVQKEVYINTKYGDKIGLIGHSKDNSSYYLKIFPNWGSVEVENVSNINATDIRNSMYENGEIKSNIIPLSVKNYIEDITNISSDTKSEWYENILNEYNMIKSYKKSWEAAPYPPTFVTTDAVVIQSGYVLMVKRKFAPGKGLWALPGGFLEQSETLIDGMIRELREETKLKVPVPVIKGSIKQQKQFDKPDRSSRGRTITTAFLVDLGYGELPKVKGTDDAEKAKWIPLGEVDREKCFEDHFSIISHFTGIE